MLSGADIKIISSSQAPSYANELLISGNGLHVFGTTDLRLIPVSSQSPEDAFNDRHRDFDLAPDFGTWRWTPGSESQKLGPFAPIASSFDGKTLIGRPVLTRADEIHTPILWTEQNGTVQLPDFNGASWGATDLSEDGSTVIGNTQFGVGYVTPDSQEPTLALRWTKGELENIGDLGGDVTFAKRVSRGGDTIAGHGTTTAGSNRLTNNGQTSAHTSDGGYGGGEGFSIFRWTANTGMQNLGTLGGNAAGLHDMSQDGEVLVGYSSSAESDTPVAFRWTAASGMHSLGTLGGASSEATLVSANGLVIAGRSALSDDRQHAFRWTESAKMENLTPTAIGDSTPVAISHNGNVIVGYQETGDFLEQERDSLFGQHTLPAVDGFYWTEKKGAISVAEWAGVSNADYEYFMPTGMSADGKTVVGSAHNKQTGLWDTWVAKRDAMTSLDQLITSISDAQKSVDMTQSLVGLVLNGAHHRPLMQQSHFLDDLNRCYWVNGDVSKSNNSPDARQNLLELGLCARASNIMVGAAIGNGRRHQDLPLSGKQHIDGDYLLTEINWLPSDNSVLLSALLMHGRWDIKAKRGYQTFSGQTLSAGNTRAESTTLRLRGDWMDALTYKTFGVTPWSSYSHTRLRVAGYNETGGDFPVAYNKQRHTAKEARLGITVGTSVWDPLRVSFTAEHAKLFDREMPTVSGHIPGVSDFSIRGGKPKKAWQRAGVDADYSLTKTAVVSLSFHAANSGMDASRSAALRLSVGF